MLGTLQIESACYLEVGEENRTRCFEMRLANRCSRYANWSRFSRPEARTKTEVGADHGMERSGIDPTHVVHSTHG
jgi:hypothetical protein